MCGMPNNHRAGQTACESVGLPVFAFVPVQTLNQTYDPENGFSKGTVFPELYKPFERGCRG